MAEEILPTSDKDLRIRQSGSQDELPKLPVRVQDVIDAIEGFSRAETQPKDSDPDHSTWNPNIGVGYNPKEYIKSFYKDLSRKGQY